MISQSRIDRNTNEEAYLSDPEIAKITKSAAFSHFAAGNVISARAEESRGKWKTIGFYTHFVDPIEFLRQHVNHDPYMYRSHLGVIVPEGEVAFKVCDEVVKWREGSVLAFDPTHPHTAWNKMMAYSPATWG